MAEQEVIKHTKKIYKVWNSKEHSFWHKCKEFLIEIFIIVFAVSLSIWLHGKSEHAHQQQEVKHFLLGLREDLLSDIREMKLDEESYLIQGKAFDYMAGILPHQTIHPDSLKKYQGWLFNVTRLQQNNGRFEGFKASGKIGAIENDSLQNDIMDLYQENIPTLLASADAYIRLKTKLLDFRMQHQKRVTDSTTNISTILLYDEARNLYNYLADPVEILDRYHTCMDKMKKIVGEIETAYHLSQ